MVGEWKWVPPLTPPKEGNTPGDGGAVGVVIDGDGWASAFPLLIDALWASEKAASGF